jgi:acetate kinase
MNAIVNIGLNIGTRVGAIDPAFAIHVVRDQGVLVERVDVRDSHTESTLILGLNRPLTLAEAHTVCHALRQDAIAQLSGDRGAVLGPKAADWGAFNPNHFLNLEP